MHATQKKRESKLMFNEPIDAGNYRFDRANPAKATPTNPNQSYMALTLIIYRNPPAVSQSELILLRASAPTQWGAQLVTTHTKGHLTRPCSMQVLSAC